MQDLHNSLHGLPTINVGAKTTSITGSGVDLQGYQGAKILVPVGVYTSYKHVCALLECDTADGTYTDVDDADIIGTEPTVSGASNILYSFGYKGQKRFIRLDTTATGSGTGVLMGAIVVRGLKRHEAGA